MDKETRELQEMDWDLDSPQVVRAAGRKHGKRTVVSVSLNSEEFNTISELAEESGTSVSKYLRNAALRNVTLTISKPTITAYAANAQIYLSGYSLTGTAGAGEALGGAIDTAAD